MKHAAEYTGIEKTLKKHDDDDIDERVASRLAFVTKWSQLNKPSPPPPDLDKQQKRLVKLEHELLDAVSAKERALGEREKHIELSTQRITTTVTSSRIKLDVGGRIFSVTSDMMLKYPDSFFARLFSGRTRRQRMERTLSTVTLIPSITL
jgi:hypothetical protein